MCVERVRARVMWGVAARCVVDDSRENGHKKVSGFLARLPCGV